MEKVWTLVSPAYHHFQRSSTLLPYHPREFVKRTLTQRGLVKRSTCMSQVLAQLDELTDILSTCVLCRAVNVPTKLLDALSQHATEHGSHPLFIHLSTDQVWGHAGGIPG